jgi:protein-S-isoprenylcysteine O-methyltransferase Ste14
VNGIRICETLWLAFLVVWVIWGIRTKATRLKEGVASQLPYTLLTVAAYYFMFGDSAGHGPLGAALLPPSRWLDLLGVAITVAGLGVAVWARACLGGNWSSSVTVKVAHQLITNGPYRWVRHPIYSGMILALLGTALVRDEPRGLLAVLLLYAGFMIKSRIEERFMTRIFGAEYENYRRHTGAIFPRVRAWRASRGG